MLALKLLVVLCGLTFFFGAASSNGTLDGAARRCLRLARGRRLLLPPLMFALAALFSAAGPGNIAACALLSPLLMSLAGRAGVPPFLAAVMLVNGANAGAFSPLSPTGIVSNGLAAAQGLAMRPWRDVFLPTFLAQTFIAAAAFLLFGGTRLRGSCAEAAEEPAPWTSAQRATLGAFGVLLAGVSVLGLDPGLLALALGAGLCALGRASAREAAARMPWGAIALVCGVSAAVSVLERLGVSAWAAGLLARVSTPETAPGVIALVAGILSTYSSSSGVVMPAMIPLVPGMIERMGGGDAAALVASINVGSHAVDASPLSTLGALCVANAPAGADKGALFRKLMINGFAMALFGALVCQLFFGGLKVVQ